MDFKVLINSLDKGDFKPIYWLQGDEPYFIDLIVDKIEALVLKPEEKSFNFTTLFGKDINSAQNIVEACMRFPMMAPKQLVIIREAQDFDFLKKSDGTRLQNYFEKPALTTVLCIAYKNKKLDGRSALAKALEKNAVVFESKSLYENQLPDFIIDYLHERKFSIEPHAQTLLIDQLGNDLKTLCNELDKVIINLYSAQRNKITVADVENYVGISREYNVFELNAALAARDVYKSFKIVDYFKSNMRNTPLVVIINSIFSQFSKSYQFSFLQTQSPMEKVKIMGLRSEWFLKEYQKLATHYNRRQIEEVIHILSDYDLKAKGVDSGGTEDGSLLTELVFKIVNIE